ncbi:hypothetical protein QBC40DRAFT_311240 [Triangularia verruculosa]|uniref:Uncharacterized protein n=1 Tax=Triangularia verruculosa TaxID=2587418 RepID=A0AAN6X678_9PEZI|nr:hypothetical protein QBC40DRAFT_311240 [Triangularia verruculosa]
MSESSESFNPFDISSRLNTVINRYNGYSGPNKGILLINPLIKEIAIYTLLKLFFKDIKTLNKLGRDKRKYLEGAIPGYGQEFPKGLHLHLELERTMVYIPEVRLGDYVMWYCNTIHAVDKTHNGHSDSSVIYIPVYPTTEANAKYMAHQRAAFLEGTPAPDFPGVQSLSLDKLVALENDTPGGKEAVRLANKALGFI